MNQLDAVKNVEGIEIYDDDFHSNYNFLEEEFKAEFCGKLSDHHLVRPFNT